MDDLELSRTSLVGDVGTMVLVSLGLHEKSRSCMLYLHTFSFDSNVFLLTGH